MKQDDIRCHISSVKIESEVKRRIQPLFAAVIQACIRVVMHNGSDVLGH